MTLVLPFIIFKPMDESEIIVKKKKKGVTEPFQREKIHNAIRKSAERILTTLTDDECMKVSDLVLDLIGDSESITVKKLHNMVEVSLDNAGFHRVAESYRQYRNYKEDFQKTMEAVDQKSIELSYKEDRSNANADSLLVSTKRALLFGEQQKEIYKRIYLNPEEQKADEEGFIYIHDKKDRLSSFNCCLFNMGRVLKGGFYLANQYYREPRYLDTALNVTGDLISAAAGQQYGGFTIPQIDQVFAEYAAKSYDYYCSEYDKIEYRKMAKMNKVSRYIYSKFLQTPEYEELRDEWAEEQVYRDACQGAEKFETSLNTVSSSRGDYAFVTFTLGLGTGRWEKLIQKAFLEVRKKGQGKDGARVPVLFPKLVFLYSKDIHGEGCINHDNFVLAADTARECMYPDFLSLDAGYIGDVYKKWGKVISPMGCRAFLSPVFKKSGWITPESENDEFLIYRCNLGVVSLNLPMIYQKSKVDGRPFFDVLDEYMEIARGIGKKAVNYLKRLKASCDPLAFMEGGFDGGTLGPDDTIEPVLKYSTITFGYGGLHELTMLHSKKRLSEDPSFALETMKHMNENIERYKQEDHLIWAIYGTPGESWLPLACEQFIKKFGKVKGVTDNGFFTNSFHMNVTDDLTPIEKIDKESEFFPLSKGGCISHVRIPQIGPEMREGVISILQHAMELGMYQSVNHAQNRCTDCGCHWIGDDSLPDDENYTCPDCGSQNTIGIRRMNGYLGYSKTLLGRTKFNDGKMNEFRFRKNI